MADDDVCHAYCAMEAGKDFDATIMSRSPRCPPPRQRCGAPAGRQFGGRAPAPHPDARRRAALHPADARRMRATIIALLAATVSAGGIGKFFRAHVDAVDKARPRSAVIDVATM